jgi:sugar lactone lactonase YvrE
MTSPVTVLDKHAYLEGPRWRDGRVWVSDLYTHQVVSADEHGGDVRVEAEVPGRPSGLGWLPDGRLLVVSMTDQQLLRREDDGSLVVHSDLSEHATWPLNDMAVDDQGRAWIGNFGFDIMNGAPPAPTPLLRVDPEGRVESVSEPLHFPNGAVVLGGTLIVAESFGHRISAFDIRADGSLSERRDWARFGPLPRSQDVHEALGELTVVPDGIAVDSEGALWVADAIGNRAIRVREGGEIVDEVSSGENGTYAVALGGGDGRTLFLCAAPDFSEHARKDTREAELLSVRVDVPGW